MPEWILFKRLRFPWFACILVTFCIPAASKVSVPAKPILSWASPVPITYGTALGANQLNATANVPGTFVYSPSSGTVLNAGAQILSVTFNPSDTVHYTSTAAKVTLHVNPVISKLTWPTPAAISYGTALSKSQLNATANVPGKFTYTPSLGEVLDAGAQLLAVTFTPADPANYTSAGAKVTLKINKSTPVIQWPTHAPVPVGAVLSASELDAVAKVAGASASLPGAYLFSPGAGTVLTSTGTETLHVTFTPEDSVNYNEVRASVPLTVTVAGIVAWGDSLTQGAQGNSAIESYTQYLEKSIVLPVINEGIIGQTSSQIGVREGGVATYATVSGGAIPAAGPVTITFPAGYEPFGPETGVPGTILGVHGVVTIVSGAYTFTRTDPGNEVSAPRAVRFYVDTPYAKYIPIFWEGRNNFRLSTVPAILPDIAAQVATVPSDGDYLVLSITNNNIAIDWSGGSEYKEILATNQQLQKAYGSHYIDVRQLLVASYDSNLITDVSDHMHDEVPTSLRAPAGVGTLAAAVGPSDTELELNMTSGTLEPLFILTIGTGADAENVSIAAVSGHKVSVIRNFGGNNTSHAAGTAVVETDKTHLNSKGYQIVADAVAKYFSRYAK